MLTKRIKFLAEVKKFHGLREMLLTLWTGIIHLNSKRFILIALTTPRTMEKALKSSNRHDFHFATPNELQKLKDDGSYEIADIDIYRVKHNISRCMVQMDGDKCTGYAWVWNNTVAYIDDGLYLNLPENTIYNYKAYTDSEYRGLGFQGLRHLKLLKLLKKEGITQLFGFVDHLNTKSLYGVKKSGYRKVGELLIKHKKGKAQATYKLNDDFWTGKPAAVDSNMNLL